MVSFLLESVDRPALQLISHVQAWRPWTSTEKQTNRKLNTVNFSMTHTMRSTKRRNYRIPCQLDAVSSKCRCLFKRYGMQWSVTQASAIFYILWKNNSCKNVHVEEPKSSVRYISYMYCTSTWVSETRQDVLSSTCWLGLQVNKWKKEGRTEGLKGGRGKRRQTGQEWRRWEAREKME